MRVGPALIILASVLLLLPAILAALIAPFGLQKGVMLPLQLLSIGLILSPVLYVVAGIGALIALYDNRQMTPTPLLAFVAAAGTNALFWLQAYGGYVVGAAVTVALVAALAWVHRRPLHVR